MRHFFKTLLKLAIVLGLISVITHIPAFANSSFLPLPSEFDKHVIPKAPDKSGQEIFQDLVLGTLRYVKIIAAVIGILFITILGYKLVISQGNEEDVTKAKQGLIYAGIAFVIISMSQDIARVFDMGDGKTLLQNPQQILNRVRLFDRQVEIFVTFTKYTVGAYATLMVLRAATGLITSGAEEEENSKNKKRILYSIGGLLLILVGQTFIDRVFYRVDRNVYSGITGVHPGVDAKAGVEQLVGITNFMLNFLGPVAVLMLIGGALMYATAGGEEEQTEKAKRLVLATIIGIIIIYGAFAVVSTVISSQLVDLGALAQ